MKTVCAFATAVVVAFNLAPAWAAETDSDIEAAAKQSYVFRTQLKDDSIRIQSKDGVVTLTGTVSEESHKSLAEDTVRSLPGVRNVDNRLEVKKSTAPAMSDRRIETKVIDVVVPS